MNEETTTRRKLIESMWLFLPVYLILISGPDLMPHIFVHHNLAPLEAGDVLSALAGYLFALAPLFLLRGIWFRCYAAALTAFAAAGFFVNGYAMIRFHAPVQTGTLDLLSTTSWRESREFMLRELASLTTLYCIVSTAAGLLILKYIGMRVQPPRNRKRSALVALACVLPMAWVYTWCTWVRPDPVGRCSAAWFALLPNQWADSRKQMDVLHDCLTNPQIPADLKLEGPADTAVIVIGESAARAHLSLYGYGRETTPALDGMKDELVVFRNVIAAMPVTNYALYYALTFKTITDQMHPRATVMEVLERAGYHIDASSTQEDFGPNSASALFAKWHPKYHDNEFDECLLADVKDALAKREGPTLIVLHIMGSHITYKNRYPEKFNVFTETELADAAGEINPLFVENINAYDNTIRYTDYVLGEIVAQLKEAGGKNVLFYFSDHGENVETSFLQNYRDAEKRDSYEVPFLFWFSPEYRAAYPERVAAAEAAVDKPLQMDRTTQGILTVFGATSREYPAKDDFLSPEFEVKPRYLMEGRIRYRENGPSSNHPNAAEPGTAEAEFEGEFEVAVDAAFEAEHGTVPEA